MLRDGLRAALGGPSFELVMARQQAARGVVDRRIDALGIVTAGALGFIAGDAIMRGRDFVRGGREHGMDQLDLVGHGGALGLQTEAASPAHVGFQRRHVAVVEGAIDGQATRRRAVQQEAGAQMFAHGLSEVYFEMEDIFKKLGVTDLGKSADGAYLGFDRFGLELLQPDRLRLAALIGLLGIGFEKQIVLSHDTVWCWRGRPLPVPVDTLAPNWDPRHVLTRIVPTLRNAGEAQEKIDAMLVHNPRRYFGGH